MSCIQVWTTTLPCNLLPKNVDSVDNVDNGDLMTVRSVAQGLVSIVVSAVSSRAPFTINQLGIKNEVFDKYGRSILVSASRLRNNPEAYLTLIGDNFIVHLNGLYDTSDFDPTRNN